LVNPVAAATALNVDPAFSDQTGKYCCPVNTLVPAWFTVRLTPLHYSPAFFMRRHDAGAIEPFIRFTTDTPTCYVRPIDTDGFRSLDDLGNKILFGIYAHDEMDVGMECIVDTEALL